MDTSITYIEGDVSNEIKENKNLWSREVGGLNFNTGIGKYSSVI